MGTFVNKAQSYNNEETIDDNELIDRIKKGDNKAFDQIVSIYEKGVYRLCYRFFNDENDAMDATQEVFIKVYKALGSFEGRSSLKTWVYRIASNTCITLAEKKKREKEGLLKTLIGWWSDRNSTTPEEEVLDQEHRSLTRELVAKKVEQLPEAYRMPVILKDIEGLPLEKIAEILEVPLGTVKSRINRGRRILQDSLQAFYYGRKR
ncbi:MAG: RNA polymerase sigma factor RpoE [Candidatus Rifleibacteriota bacterium]